MDSTSLKFLLKYDYKNIYELFFDHIGINLKEWAAVCEDNYVELVDELLANDIMISEEQNRLEVHGDSNTIFVSDNSLLVCGATPKLYSEIVRRISEFREGRSE